VLSPTGSLLFAAWLSVVALSFGVVRDSFSPDKLLLVALGLFFGDIFFHDYSRELCSVYLLLLVALSAALVALAPLLRRAGRAPASGVPLGAQSGPGGAAIGYTLFWLVSLPSLAAQVWMIALFGGMVGYINALALSVVNFEGLGWLMSIIRTFSIVNLLYFSFLVTRRQRTTGEVLFYLLHLCIFVVMALLTGSRGSLLANFAMMALIYHHSVRRISARWLLIFAVGALMVASLLEVAREGVGFGKEGLVTGLSKESSNDAKMSFGWAKYGIIPLDLVLSAEHVEPHYGFTYLTVITNFVPRAFWPAKPDPGGNVLTNEYAGDAWGGTSFLSTGIIPEAIINFGPGLGICLGTLQFGLVAGWLLLYYARYRRRLAGNDPFSFIENVRYAYLNWGAMGLIVGEFTNIVVLLLIQLATVWMLRQLIRYSSRKSVSRGAAPRRRHRELATRAAAL